MLYKNESMRKWANTHPQFMQGLEVAEVLRYDGLFDWWDCIESEMKKETNHS